MKYLAEWLARLREAKPEALRELIARVVIPGHASPLVTDTVLKIEPLGPVYPRPGATDPQFASLLRFFDTLPFGIGACNVATDIGAAVSLVAGRKFAVAFEIPISMAEQPQHLTFLSLGPTVDFNCRGPFPLDLKDRLVSFLERIGSLEGRDLATLGSAMRLHYGALVTCDHDVRSAYLLLVAALEVLSREYGDPPTDWSAWDGAQLWDVVMEDAGLGAEQSARVRAALMKDRQLRLKSTFRKYVCDRLPDGFWEEPWEEWHYPLHLRTAEWGQPSASRRPLEEILPRDRDLLSAVMGNTYDLRSSVVHRGVEPEHYSIGVKAAATVRETEPVPYALLRHIVATLIRVEFEERSASAGRLPDIRFI